VLLICGCVDAKSGVARMGARWVLLLFAGVMILMLSSACSGRSGDGGSSPGNLTSAQAGDRVRELLAAAGCDSPPNNYSMVTHVDGVWKLRASIGLFAFSWTFDPVADTVVEAEGRCNVR
jgi:hypothetical protein